jgi:TolA-binding protein
MSSRKQVNKLHSGIGIGSAVLAICLIAGACNKKESSSATSAEAAKPQQPAGAQAIQPSAQVQPAKAGADQAARQPAVTTPRQSPKPETPKAECNPPALVSDEYVARLEALRSLLQDARQRGQIDEAVAALVSLLSAVEQQESTAMAQRVALAEAGNLQAQKDYPAAVKAYELALSRYPQGMFVAEATYQLGDCRLELHDYAAAEQVWRRMIDEHGNSSMVPWAWRKLALAQLLQAHYEDSLATLAAMAGQYAGTEYEEYARMRKGYVLAAAGRTEEARAAYAEFLKAFPRSKYRGLANKQMDELNAGMALVKARH